MLVPLLMTDSYDTIVIGLGGMGSAALFHLAAKGARVLGLDQFVPPHDRGSSHGLSRIIRLAYWEHPIYVPLVRRAHQLWRELETASGIPLLTVTGSLDIGSPGGRLYRGALESAIRYGLPHEDLSAHEVTERFPAFQLPSSLRAVFQPDGGSLRPEQAILVHLQCASAAGAEIHTGERVIAWTPSDARVVVTTDARTFQLLAPGHHRWPLEPDGAGRQDSDRARSGAAGRRLDEAADGRVPASALPGVLHGGGRRPVLRIPRGRGRLQRSGSITTWDKW